MLELTQILGQPCGFQVPGGAAALLCGVQGAATAVPRGHRTQVLLRLGEGLSRSVLGWGSELLRYHGKAPTPDDFNVHVARLGYSTVGHYFYGLVRGKSAEETLGAVADDARRLQIPHGWYTLDSWYICIAYTHLDYITRV